MADIDLGQQIVDSLIAKQRDDPDRAFADKLGVSRPLWQKTRYGTIRLGRAIALAVLDLYPELRPSATAYLLSPRAIGSSSPDNGNAAGAVGNTVPDNEILEAVHG